MSDPSPTAQGTSDTARLETFADGVIAIAITLLILDVKLVQSLLLFPSLLLFFSVWLKSCYEADLPIWQYGSYLGRTFKRLCYSNKQCEGRCHPRLGTDKNAVEGTNEINLPVLGSVYPITKQDSY